MHAIMRENSPKSLNHLEEALHPSTGTQHSVTGKISNIAHVRVSVNDLVAFEYVGENTNEWKWGLGTVAAIPGPRLVQLMLWAGSSGDTPPEDAPVSNAEREEAVKQLKEIEKRRQEAEKEMEDLNKTLTVQQAYYNENRAAYEAEAARAEEAAAEAKEEVLNLNETDWREIRSYVKPPEIVKLVTEALLLILGERIVDWNYTLKVIRQRTFSKRLQEFDPQSISLATRRRIRKEYFSNPRFTHRDSMEGSRALGIVQRWVSAQLATNEAKVDIMEFEKARSRDKNQIEILESTLRQRRNDVEGYKEEETRLRNKLGDHSMRLEYDKHMRHSPRNSSSVRKKFGMAKTVLSPRNGNPGKDTNGARPRGRPGAPPLHENVHGSSRTWAFTETTTIILHSSILVNYDRPASTVVVLTPEQVEQLREALKSRAVLFAEQQRTDDKIQDMENGLESLRRVLADTMQELADAKVSLAAHSAELAAKDREIADITKAASPSASPVDTNKKGLTFVPELAEETSDNERDLNAPPTALEAGEKRKKNRNKGSASRRGGLGDVELEKEPVMNIMPLNETTEALYHAGDDRQLAKIIERLEKEIRILRSESESANFVLHGVEDMIRAAPELQQYIKEDE